MKKLLALFIAPLLLLHGTVQSQSGGKSAPSSAPVNVIVTDSKNLPLKGQDVLFSDASGKTKLRVRTNETGTCSFSLPAGATYTVQLKTLTDTINYTELPIPALEAGQFYTSPFTLTIQYEPARTFTLNDVHFDTGKPTLRPDSFKELNEIAEYLRLKNEGLYEIAGHTDNVGKDADNLRLSQQRAETVVSYLVKKGVRAELLQAKGYGATRPVAENSTPEGRQKNRRTELVFL